MPDDRARTLIKQGRVTLQNRWMTRHWAQLVGFTDDLDHAGRQVWIDRPTEEFRLAIDGQDYGLFSLDEVEWVEDCTPLGAEILMRRQNAEFTLELRTFMFHERPGLWRRSRIINRSGRERRLQQACVEFIPIDDDTGTVTTEGLDTPALGISWTQENRVLGLVRGQAGLILAAGKGGRSIHREIEGVAAVCTATELGLPPAAWVNLPDAYVLPCDGPPKAAWETDFEPFLRHINSSLELDQNRIEAAREPVDEDPQDPRPSGAPEN